MKTKTIALLVLLALSLLLSACNDDLIWWDGETKTSGTPVRVDANTTCVNGVCSAEFCRLNPITLETVCEIVKSK